jgi:hypothetical protein
LCRYAAASSEDVGGTDGEGSPGVGGKSRNNIRVGMAEDIDEFSEAAMEQNEVGLYKLNAVEPNLSLTAPGFKLKPEM